MLRVRRFPGQVESWNGVNVRQFAHLKFERFHVRRVSLKVEFSVELRDSMFERLKIRSCETFDCERLGIW